jgi:small subunit ribosomal protein S9
MAKKEKTIVTMGRKKTAIARVTIQEGVGDIKINGVPLSIVKPESAKEVIMEPILLGQDVLGKNFEYGLSISANIHGGGIMGQAYAARTAIGKALVRWTGSDSLKKAYHDYDRSLIIDDIRIKEPKKYLRKGARAKPIKSYR